MTVLECLPFLRAIHAKKRVSLPVTRNSEAPASARPQQPPVPPSSGLEEEKDEGEEGCFGVDLEEASKWVVCRKVKRNARFR